MGQQCPNPIVYRIGLCSNRRVAVLGEETPRNARGSYFLETFDRSPFGRGWWDYAWQTGTKTLSGMLRITWCSYGMHWWMYRVFSYFFSIPIKILDGKLVHISIPYRNFLYPHRFLKINENKLNIRVFGPTIFMFYVWQFNKINVSTKNLDLLIFPLNPFCWIWISWFFLNINTWLRYFLNHLKIKPFV